MGLRALDDQLRRGRDGGDFVGGDALIKAKVRAPKALDGQIAADDLRATALDGSTIPLRSFQTHEYQKDQRREFAAKSTIDLNNLKLEFSKTHWKIQVSICVSGCFAYLGFFY